MSTPVLILDVWDNSELEEDGLRKTRVLSGMVTDISIANGATARQALEVARDVVYASIAPNDLFPGTTDLAFKRLRVVPISDEAVRVLLYFDNRIGALISSYVLRDRSAVTQVQTNLVPGTRQPIKIDFRGAAKDELNNGIIGYPIPEDTITMNFFMPVRQLSVSVIAAGAAPTGYQNAVGLVNEDAWMGKPKGWWMLTSFASESSRYRGFTQTEAVATCRNYADWSETGIMQSRITGRHPTIEDAVIVAMNAAPYVHGVIYPPNGTPNLKGIVRVGPAPTTNFAAIFGFSS